MLEMAGGDYQSSRRALDCLLCSGRAEMTELSVAFQWTRGSNLSAAEQLDSNQENQKGSRLSHIRLHRPSKEFKLTPAKML